MPEPGSAEDRDLRVERLSELDDGGVFVLEDRLGKHSADLWIGRRRRDRAVQDALVAVVSEVAGVGDELCRVVVGGGGRDRGRGGRLGGDSTPPASTCRHCPEGSPVMSSCRSWKPGGPNSRIVPPYPGFRQVQEPFGRAGEAPGGPGAFVVVLARAGTVRGAGQGRVMVGAGRHGGVIG